MGGEKMAKRSIGSLMRKKLSDITNNNNNNYADSHAQHKLLHTLPSDNPSIQQLIQERTTLMQLIAEKDEMIELNGAELRRLQADIKKLQLQNWNLAQSNSLMLAELNLGRERIKTLQHEISWRAALLKGKSSDVQERVEMDHEKNASLSQSHVPGLKEGDEKAGQPSHKVSNDEQQNHMNRRRIRSRSTGSTTDSKQNASKDKVKDNRRRSRRHSAMFRTHEHEPLENLFEIEDAIILSSSAVKDDKGESSTLRNEARRTSFGRPLRRAAEKVQSYKEVPLNVKMRRLE